jgi:hypothetical protein
MNRTYKRFLKKIGTGLLSFSKFIGAWIAMAIPICGIVFLLTGDASLSIFAGVIASTLSYLVWLVLKDVWDDSKAEVERENRSMMNTLKGKDY